VDYHTADSLESVDERMRGIIVDNHPVTRDGLRMLFGTMEEIDVVGEASSGEEAIEVAQELSPDVVFMSERMPGMNGIQATRIIRGRRPETKVILLTTNESQASLVKAIQAGASGYLAKDVGVKELIDVAKQVRAGKAVIDPILSQDFGAEVEQPDRKQPSLSPREIEILQKVAYGATTKEVADELGISFHDVKTSLAAIFDKLSLYERMHAVVEEARYRETAAPISGQGGDSVQVCHKHDCCYEVILRDAVGLPLNRAGEWHFTWHQDSGVWLLRYPARHITTERRVPEGVSPTVALLGGIPGKTISHVADQIERLGFPPPRCGPEVGQHVVKEPTEINRIRPYS
jgi:DNA-binding NarL/FixJ family response regulator